MAPHEIPTGELVTVPEPSVSTVSAYAGTTAVNVAVTARAALIVSEHVPVPVQAPLQPVKVEPVAGVAVSATAVPLA